MFRVEIHYTDGTGEYALIGANDVVEALAKTLKYWGKGEIDYVKCGGRLLHQRKN